VKRLLTVTSLTWECDNNMDKTNKKTWIKTERFKIFYLVFKCLGYVKDD
jgi:hypothetical protein